ncbi:hypothetical protein EJB05_39412, partial [Eragrostis curvula]
MTKRPRSPRDNSGRTTKRPAAPQVKQKHLYLMVDDWERGYSVYRVDEDAFDSSLDTPLVRMEAEHGGSRSLVAHGTKILAMKPKQSSTGIPAFDTETLGVSVYPDPRSRRGGYIGGKPVYASVGDRLLAFYWPFLEGDGRFCLLESRAPTDGDPSKRIRVVKMDSFALKYDKDGDLRRTRHRAHASVSYEVAHKCFDRSDNPVAFWM